MSLRQQGGSLVLRWTSKLGRCLTQQSKRSCSEATTEKAISDKPSVDYVRGVPQRNNKVEMKEVNGVLQEGAVIPLLRTRDENVARGSPLEDY